jgi:hypothetical protein
MTDIWNWITFRPETDPLPVSLYLLTRRFCVAEELLLLKHRFECRDVTKLLLRGCEEASDAQLWKQTI